MANLSLPEPPPPFACSICERPEHSLKAGPACESCPAFKNTHYFPSGEGSDVADLVIVGDVPTAPRVFLAGGKATQSFDLTHQSFKEDGAKVLKNAVLELQSQRPAFKLLSTRYVYGVKCAVDSPNKATIVACSTPLKLELNRIYSLRQSARPDENLTVLACGVHALHSLGIPVKGEKEALGRVYMNVPFGDAVLNVVFTRSLKAIGAAVGKYSSLVADVERAMRLATRTEVIRLPREDVERNYVYPKTIEEVRAVIRTIHEYARPGAGVAPKDWKITCDTETNTLHPHWDGLELVAVSFAWDEGLATTIPLWHKETPYDPQAAFEEVCWLLRSGKPIIWFNAKYDFKVFWKKGWPLGDVGNIFWDVFIAEHVLEEDKKGLYSLKYLTKQNFPELSGYEDKLHDELEKNDTAGLTTVEVQPGKKALKLPPIIAETLERAIAGKFIKGHTFQVKTLEKRIEKGGLTPEQLKDLTLLVNAKKAGEFNGKAEKEAKAEKAIKGGFENVSLKEMYFYAAVDADVTRRSAIRQVQRMAEEDDRIDRARVFMRREIDNSIPGSDLSFRTVKVLCPRPEPLRWLVQEHGVKLQTELAKIEYQGVNIDQDYREWGHRALTQTVAATTQKVYELCEESFNINSGKQLVKYLFETGFRHPDPELAAQIAEENPKTVKYVDGRMWYRPSHYTAKGAVQTGAPVLKHLVQRYKCPLANLLMTEKKADTGLKSFFVNIGKLSHMWGDGRIHPGYNQTGTSTSRLSASSGIKLIGFNNQNIPKGLIGALKDARGELIRDGAGNIIFEGVKCKKLFIPDSADHIFFNADAKGAEVTVFAGYAQDQALGEALRQGMDPHCFFGSRCLNPELVAAGLSGVERKQALMKAGIDDDHAWTYEDFVAGKDCEFGTKGVTVCVHGEHAYCKRLKELRDNIKRLVFGILYGAGVKKIADIAGINLELAEQIQKLLFSEFPSIPIFDSQTKWEMNMFRMVESYTGRRRRFALGRYAPKSLLSRAERQALNFYIQETSSTIVLRALYKAAEILERDMRGRLLLTVHDSIGGQVPKEYAGQLKDLFYEVGTKQVAKENPWLLSPYRWDVEVGSSYGTVVAFDKYMAGQTTPQVPIELDGYTEEEVFEVLRDHEEYDLPERRKAP